MGKARTAKDSGTVGKARSAKAPTAEGSGGVAQDSGTVGVKVRALPAEAVYPAALLIAAMVAESGHPHPSDLLVRLYSELMADTLAGIAVVYLAVLDGAGEPVPCGVVEVKEIRSAAGSHLEVFRLYVPPLHRKRGVARRLLQAAVAGLPADLDCPVLLSTDGPLPRSYARMGFAPVATVSAAPLAVIRERMKVH